MKLADYKPSAVRKVLIYGPPKTGKTELASSLATIGKRLWWFDLDNGIQTILRPGAVAEKYLDRFELFRLPDTQSYSIGIETLRKVFKGGPLKICHRCGRVNCLACSKAFPSDYTDINTDEFTNEDVLVVDSISQLASSAMNYINKDLIAKGSDDVKPGWDEYFKQGFLMDQILMQIQQSRYNVVCISHEEMVKMEDKSEKLVPITGTSNFSRKGAKYFDDVVYTEIVNGKYRAYSDGTQKNSAIIGSRTGKKLTEGKGIIELFQ